MGLVADDQVDENHQKHTIDLLVIGSSIVKYIDAKKIERRNPETSQTICIPGGKCHDILRKLKAMTNSHNVNKMVVHVGANHMPHDSPNDIARHLSNMYREIKTLFPKTLIYDSSMIPRLDNRFLSATNFVNNRVTEICNQLRIKTIFHPQFGYDDINFQFLKQDGVHPTYTGTAIIAKNIIAVYRNYDRNRSILQA